MTLTVRKAVRGDLPALLAIYENARRFMQTHGNPTQWPAGYPGAARLTAEIDRGVCHVVTGAGEIQAVFCLIPGEDPTYHKIEDGAWPEDVPYATIHRLASAGQVGGIGRFCIDWCLQQGLPLRADTHADNIYMLPCRHGGGRDTGRVLPDPRRGPHLPQNRGRRMAGGCPLCHDPPPGIGRAGGWYRAVLH